MNREDRCCKDNTQAIWLFRLEDLLLLQLDNNLLTFCESLLSFILLLLCGGTLSSITKYAEVLHLINLTVLMQSHFVFKTITYPIYRLQQSKVRTNMWNDALKHLPDEKAYFNVLCSNFDTSKFTGE